MANEVSKPETRKGPYRQILVWNAQEEAALHLAAAKQGMRRHAFVRSLILRELLAVDPSLIQSPR